MAEAPRANNSNSQGKQQGDDVIMKSDSGSTVSIWMGMADVPAQPDLVQNLEAEVCVIGAGIAGLTTAYLLSRQGKSFIVLDDGPLAGGETCRTTAHLTNAFDDRYLEAERLHGTEGARIIAASHTAAIDEMEAIANQEQIDCDFQRVDGYLFMKPGDAVESLEEELRAAHRAGLSYVEKIERAPIAFWNSGPCLRFPRQGQMHPLKYLSGLALAIRRFGGRIYSHAHAEKIDSGPPAKVQVRGGATVTAQAVVVATNSPVNDRVAIHTKQAAYRTYVIGARVPRGSVPQLLLWDTGWPYHYVRLQEVPANESAAASRIGDFDMLIVGGEDHKTGQIPPEHAPFASLETWARERFPMIEAIEFRWSGQVMEPVDYVAFIGKNPMDSDHIFIATGDSGQGMTHGTIAGMILTDLIMGHENPWAKLYDPSRKTLRATGEFASENVNVLRQYADLATPAEVSSIEEIRPGMGAILRRGLVKHAVYRDEDGTLHERSAICRHLGCVVSWNSLEKTWDCPCHGSRFNRYGEVINGPANENLEVKTESSEAERRAA
jgi:glycine/D-amino acid oxidase-like deaminating enzyme/nitrite reductase/ring-hydroxylating ferredoxin subunit